MSDLTTDQKVNLLFTTAFPKGVQMNEDDSLAMSPAPTPVKVGETITYTISGIDTSDPTIDTKLYQPMVGPAFATATLDPDGVTLRVTGVESGPAGSRCMISCPRNGLPGIWFYQTVLKGA